MYHLIEIEQIKKEDSWYALTTLEIIQGKIKNPVEDIRKGKITKENVSELVRMAFNWRFISWPHYTSFQKELSKIP